jgi:hypothetical protein
MPLTIAMPSPTSRLYTVAARALDTLRGRPTAPLGSVLLESLPDGLHAASSEWDSMCAQQAPPSRIRGLLRKYAPHATTGVILVAAGLVLPEVLPALRGATGSNLRTVLVLSGLVALVPVDGDSLNRIPDAFSDAVNPRG